MAGTLLAKIENLIRKRPDLTGFEDAAILAVVKQDEIVQTIANKYQHVHFLKLDADKFREEWFLDDCYLTELGEIEKAKQISEFLRKYID